jgi:hypothetical protein
MKIDVIHITDATTEEAQQVLTGLGLGSTPARRKAIPASVARNFSSEGWDDEERETIRDCPDSSAAIRAHREKYLVTKRTTAAIRRMWQNLQKKPEKGRPPLPQPSDAAPAGKPAGDAPAHHAAQNPKKTRAKGPVRSGPKGKKGIPAGLSTSDPKKYARILYRINRGGMTYEQALACEDKVRPPLDADKLPAKKQKKAPAADQDPVPPPSGQSSDDVITRYDGDGKDDASAITLDKFSPSENIVGWKVRQIKADNGRQFFGTGQVIARRASGLIHVRNGDGQVHIVDARCLAVVPHGKEEMDAAAAGDTA